MSNAILTWDSVSNVDGYNVYIDRNGAGFVKENSVLITETTFTFENLTEALYEVYVTSVFNDRESLPSNVVAFSTIPPVVEFIANGSFETGTIQEYEAPIAGDYRITAFGAQGGGDNGGLGAKIEGVFSLTEGQVLKILVGQRGETGQYSGANTHGAGGGGTFVMLDGATDESGILVIAGGGGGSMANFSQNKHAAIATAGQSGALGGAGNIGSGGSNGNGGASAHDKGGGGAGLLTNGQSATNGEGGKSYLNGGGGGVESTGANGGFGGGGASSSNGWHGCGGGGGYSGGGGVAGRSNFDHVGGGGGSYNNGTQKVEEALVQTGNGKAIIELL